MSYKIVATAHSLSDIGTQPSDGSSYIGVLTAALPEELATKQLAILQDLIGLQGVEWDKSKPNVVRTQTITLTLTMSGWKQGGTSSIEMKWNLSPEQTKGANGWEQWITEVSNRLHALGFSTAEV